MNKKQNISQNILVGLTVSFVALSLGAAFGILSGRGAFAGMLSAAIIALITSIFGGTRVQCSGPTAPMTTVTVVAIAFAHDYVTKYAPQFSADHIITVILILTGLFLIIAGIFKLGRFITLVPNVVISGFMNGIAILIWLDQLKRIIGFGGKTPYTGSIWQNTIVAILTAVLVFTLPSLFKRWLPKFASLLSGTFIAIVVMTLLSNIINLPIEHVHITGSLKSINDLTSLIKTQIPSTWSWELIKIAIPFALQLTILAYLDSLLTSLVVDKMTKESTNQNKELIAQGLANGIVGLLGGIPGAQATIRSVLIIKEKATSRLAGIMVGIFALIEIVLLQDTINLIPQAVFTGVLIKVGYDVFDWSPLRLYFKEWIKNKKSLLHNFFSRNDDIKIFVTNREFIIILGTTLVTILWNLNAAVAIFTILFYLHNKWLFKNNPMRDLKPEIETEGIED